MPTTPSSWQQVGKVIVLAASKLVQFFSKWKMSVNEGKTEVMLPGKRSAKQEVVRVGKVKRKIKYLRVELDRKDTMEGNVRPSFVWEDWTAVWTSILG